MKSQFEIKNQKPNSRVNQKSISKLKIKSQFKT